MSLKNLTSFGTVYEEKIPKEARQRLKHKFQDANLSDDLLFAVLMQNEDFCKIVLSIVLEKEVTQVRQRSVQKSIINVMGYRGIRLDVFAQLEDGSVYNVEMQKIQNDNLAKRSRFYQGIMDSVSLPSGKDVVYEMLPDSLIVFITGFDPFGKGLYKYTFENTCKEIAGLELKDGAKKMFLSTVGTKYNGESEILLQFLKYVENSVEANVGRFNELRNLNNILQKLKQDSEMEGRYMDTSWAIIEAERRATREGVEKGIRSLISYARSRGDSDREIVKVLRKEYGLTEDEALTYL